MRIDIVYDLVCPWCFIGKRRLERAMAMRPQIAVRRSWRPFQLNPEMPPTGMPRELYLQLKFGGARSAARIHTTIAAAGRSEGIDFAFGKIRRIPNTVNAHRLIAAAAAEGCADRLVEALFRGYFTDGLDIGDVATLAAIADQCGLDRTATRASLAGEAGIAAVLAEDDRARRTGIHAVPCFIVDGRYAVSGAQEPEMFLPLFDLAAAGRLTPAAA